MKPLAETLWRCKEFEIYLRLYNIYKDLWIEDYMTIEIIENILTTIHNKINNETH